VTVTPPSDFGMLEKRPSNHTDVQSHGNLCRSSQSDEAAQHCTAVNMNS